MGCSDSSEDKMYLAKLSRLEIQVKKQKEIEKLAKIEGKNIEDLNYLSLSKPGKGNKLPNTEPNSLTKGTKGTKTTKNTKITIKKRRRNNSENKEKKIKKTKKTKDAPAKKKKRAKSENNKKKKKKKK